MEMSSQTETGLVSAEAERNVSVVDSHAMKSMMREINAHAETLPEGEILMVNNFAHLGKPAEISRAITGLMKQGDLFHVEKEYFVRGLQGMTIKYFPEDKIILENLEKMTGETFVENGACAANLFRLTHHVPGRFIYWTSGPERELNIGGLVLELQHVPEWKLIFPYTKVGDAFRAIVITGKDRAKKSLKKIKPLFKEDEQQEFALLKSCVKDWLAGEFTKIVEKMNASDDIEPAM